MQIQIEQKQKQIITQNMLQSVEILQMGAQELAEYIEEKALENPVMDLEQKEAEGREQEQIRKMEWLSSLDEQNRAYYAYDVDEKEKDYFDRIGKREAETLEDALYLQLIGKGYSDREMEIFDYMIQSLDEKGYFKLPVKEVAEHFQVSEEEIQKYLIVMKGLEPAGVCAGSLEECLLIQLKQKGKENDVEYVIVKHYLELLSKNQLHNLAKILDVSIERVKEAVQIIKSLNPRPAQGFDNGEMLRYTVPDIIIVKVPDGFEILLNTYSYPSFHLNKEYVSMYQNSNNKEVREYLSRKIKQADYIRECIVKRHTTLMELAKFILEKQKDFFCYGENKILPMKLIDAAEAMGVHESTISRALKDKYLQCCWGIYPLHYFFSREFLSGEGESALSSTVVKQQLKKLMEEEDKKKPFSDQKLADLMTEQGIPISRRTVTKYREAMGIPNGRKRKEF